MFSCLYKKVNINKDSKLSIISCHKQNNLIAIGGADGFLKIVQIDLNKSKGDSNANPITFTQNLVCHTKKISCLRWNDYYDKLTTCDEDGVIVVWRQNEKAQWDTEMINNREISSVTDIKWSKQGTHLCFIYDDGHGIVGTVEGSRCWGNDIREKLYKLEWSPDASCILFAAMNHNIIIFSTSGYQVGEMEIDAALKSTKISSISWWANSFSENFNSTLEKHMMIAFSNGTIMLYDDYQDTKPLKFVTEFSEITQAEWNQTGEIIAVSGILQEGAERRDAIIFYSAQGEVQKILRVPTPISEFTWDAQGTKLAIASENVILFALVKQKYKWTYFADTLVYCFMQETE